ncbi:MAG: GNAT family N-acetyltransferase [Patescibacteria group bacterium]|nr:GNAT family N-acetyltransferase [Patescibacteria group bacterium]
MNIFNHGKDLLRDIFYSDIRRFETFSYLKSVFTEKWYNLIEPTVPPNNLDWYTVYSILDRETRARVGVSYYVPHHLYAAYKPFLQRKGYTLAWDDTYLRKTLLKTEHLPDGVFRDIDERTLEEYLRISGVCFPDFSNNAEYGGMCVEFARRGRPEDDKVMRNIMLFDAGQPVAFGSVLYSRSLRLAYIHNVGTHPEHRRKGHFARLIQFLCHEAALDDVSEIYANAKTDGPSYHGFLSCGFQENIRYHLFTS